VQRETTFFQLKVWEDFQSVLLKGMNILIPKGKKSPTKWKKNFHPFNRELQQLIHKNIDY